MRVLFVTPSETASGEAITARGVALDVVADGGEVSFLASPLASRLLGPSFGASVTTLSGDRGHNQVLWGSALAATRPDAIVFADYPLLFFRTGASPLADDAWVASLQRGDAVLVTLDHLGYAQRARTVFFGPPHRSFHSEAIPALPPGMQVLLPCPINSPQPVDARTGIPFRGLQLPVPDDPAARREARRRHAGGGGLMVVHLVPGWSWRLADQFGLPYYAHLARLLLHHLRDVPAPVTVVSVNNGSLLGCSSDGARRVVDLPELDVAEFDALILAADLVLTENMISAALGKAVCGLRPCAALHNTRRLADVIERADAPLRALVLEMERAAPGAVYPWEVFPIWGGDDLADLGVFVANPYLRGFEPVEVFGDREATDQLCRLLLEDDARADQRRHQESYNEALAGLPGPSEALRALAGVT